MKEQFNEYVDAYHTHGLWIPARKIYLKAGGSEDDPEIDYRSAEQLIKNIDILHALGQEPITVVINTPGGSDTDAKAIYDVVKDSPCHMIGVGVGEVSSSGVTILQAFDQRKAYRSTYFLVHDGSNSASGNARDVERQVEASRQIRLDYYRLLEKSTGKAHQYWARKLQTDYVLNAEQALSEGLIDEVI